MLDLSQERVEYWDVKIPTGDILNIKVPTLRFRNKLVKASLEVEKLNDEETENVLTGIVVEILNKNINGVVVTEDQVNSWFSEPVKNVIVNEYASFIKRISQRKN